MSLIAYYPFNGSAKDAVGDRHGSLSGGLGYTPGLFGHALHFTANTNVVTIPHDDELSAKVFGTSTVFSFSCRYFIDSYNNYGCLVTKAFGGSWSNTTAGIWVYGGGIRAVVGSNVSGNPTDSSRYVEYAPPIGNWYNIAVVANGETMTLFVNGVDRGSVSILDLVSGRSQNTGPITIGPRYPGGSSLLRGRLQDLKIYTHALSRREVYDLNLDLMHRFQLSGHLKDTVQTSQAVLQNGSFVDNEIGTVADVVSGYVHIPLSQINMRLKGETITFWQNSAFPRTSSLGGGFSNRIIQWGSYYTDNSGGFGLQSGQLRYYLRGPGASGWTNTGTVWAADEIYDKHDWIHYAIVFTEANRIEIYMNGTLVANIGLSVPYTGLASAGVFFGENMQAMVSDIRVFAEPLLQADIRSMYETRATIDNKGNIHAKTFDENGYLIAARPNRVVGNPGFTTITNVDRETYQADTSLITAINGSALDWYEYDFHVMEAGNFTISAFMLSLDGTTDSFFIAVNDETLTAWHTGTTGVWAWNTWATKTLPKGYNKLKVGVRESGVEVSAFRILDVSGKLIPAMRQSFGRRLSAGELSEIGSLREIVSWVPFEHNVEDVHRGLSLNNVNNVSRGGLGYAFNGVDQRLILPNPGLSTVAHHWTITFAIFPTSAGRFLSPNSAGVDHFLQYTGGNVAFNFTEAADTNNRSLSYPIPSNKWSTVAVQIDGNVCRLFVNGDLAAQRTETIPIAYWTGDWTLGARANATYFFGGELSDLRIFDCVLTPAEVRGIHLSSKANVPKGFSLSGESLFLGTSLIEA